MFNEIINNEESTPPDIVRPPTKPDTQKIQTPKNLVGLQYRRIQQRHIPNDSISNAFFNQAPENYEEGAFAIDESNKPKYKDLKTLVKITYANNEVVYFSHFHRLILNACISEQVDGNEFITVNAIFKNISGAINNNFIKPDMRNKILQALTELNSTNIELDLSAIAGKWKNYYIDEPIIKGAILPGYLTKAKVHGKETLIFVFEGESPFYTAAKLKNNQILTYPVDLLNLPLNNTFNIILLKNYLMHRIQSSINHAQMRQSILIDSIFNDLDFDFSAKDKCITIKIIDKILNYLQQMQVIKSYDIPKENGSRKRILFECERTERAIDWLKRKQKLQRNRKS